VMHVLAVVDTLHMIHQVMGSVLAVHQLKMP